MTGNLIDTELEFELCSAENGDCVLIKHSHYYKTNITKNDIEELIELLKNSINHIDRINTFSEYQNDEIWKELNKPFVKVKKEVLAKIGFIYVAKCNRTGLYKIGSTSKQSVEKRIYQLRTSNPNIELSTSFATNDIKDEKYFHSHFESKKVSGEWFELNDLDLEVIKNFYKE